MKLSIIILNYNVCHFLELCLKSVQAATVNIDSEIIVVDNNSEDDSCHMVKTLFPEVILIENKVNGGFSKGNNIGVSRAKGEYLCILNPDTVVAEDTFIQLINFSKTKTNLGIVGCKLINGSGVFLPESKRNIPYVSVALKKICGNSKGYYANHVDQDDSGKVDILVGAFMFLKRTIYNEIGGLDEDYFMYGEDIDLSYKALQANYDNYYYGKTTVIHYKGESTLKDKNYARRFFDAMQIFYKKHFKKNQLFDMVVWLGIKFFFVIQTVPKKRAKHVSKYIFISDKENLALEKVLEKPLFLKNEIKTVEKEVEVIFDANYLGFKDMIQMIESTFSQNKSVTYKILPNNSNFIIGSDNGLARGEIISFK
ncbi:glycosyltransferase family 2 protein [Tamlana sp. 2_MG-2023]|uniref:glycosyltransferase family 2 protein n=1 Tax=unclassified Tamlana TaxID=2614803 RepID=UPI0026E3A2B6|nr:MULTISPECIES: glycosyltransferase family 2 protein [unclassified Tamlana]MDO6760141.1 glycosyltransferase family 2 protein [Tamlana sp. 2_MG-2023]MDO6790161.1 glycosyltransferase family 2 protein [Tamlana sp. 1_MG-2023]